MEYLKVWTSFAEILEPLNDSERGRLFTAMLIYAERGEMPEFKGNERYIWPVAKQSIDRARTESDRGSKGGRPRKEESSEKLNETQENLEKLNETQENHKDNNKDNDKENNKEILKETHSNECVKKSAPRFTPPTLEEVKAYCTERNNGINAERWFDYYAANGWKIGKNPMKDWKASVRYWEKDNTSVSSQSQKKVSAQNYTQRQYTEEQLAAVTNNPLEAILRQMDRAKGVSA